VLCESFIEEVVQEDKILLQSNTARTDTEAQSHSRSDKCMEEIGFKWKLTHHVTMTFEKCCRDLEAFFKTEFGHCNVPNSCSANPSLGKWCRKMKYSYNQIQQGQNPGMILTQDQIERLEETSFKWIILEAFE
jgi:hypothetical protein